MPPKLDPFSEKALNEDASHHRWCHYKKTTQALIGSFTWKCPNFSTHTFKLQYAVQYHSGLAFRYVCLVICTKKIKILASMNLSMEGVSWQLCAIPMRKAVCKMYFNTPCLSHLHFKLIILIWSVQCVRNWLTLSTCWQNGNRLDGHFQCKQTNYFIATNLL